LNFFFLERKSACCNFFVCSFFEALCCVNHMALLVTLILLLVKISLPIILPFPQTLLPTIFSTLFPIFCYLNNLTSFTTILPILNIMFPKSFNSLSTKRYRTPMFRSEPTLCGLWVCLFYGFFALHVCA
jgi:hypothetical protein